MKEVKRSGYIYSPGTKKGFARMRRLGIPGPSLKNENRLTKYLSGLYSRMAEKFLRQFREAAVFSGLKFDGRFLTHDSAEDDTLADLMAFFEEMGAESQKAESAAQTRAAVQNAVFIMEAEPGADFMEGIDPGPLENILKDNQEEFLGKFMDDASDEITGLIRSFSLDQRKLYDENMDALRRLYLDNSLERIAGEEDLLKARLLQKLNDYVEGRTAFLDIEEVVRGLQDDTAHMARFFARDQMARFNKATTISQYELAGVRRVKWVTSHDVRVRKSHRELDGQIFDLDNLPPEKDDYNCRCGLIPVDFAE